MPWTPCQSADLMTLPTLVLKHLEDQTVTLVFLDLLLLDILILFHELLQHYTTFHQPCIAPDRETTEIWC